MHAQLVREARQRFLRLGHVEPDIEMAQLVTFPCIGVAAPQDLHWLNSHLFQMES